MITRRTVIYGVILVAVVLFLWIPRVVLDITPDPAERISIGELATMINDPAQRVNILSIQSGPDNLVRIYHRNGQSYITYKDPSESLPSQLRALGVPGEAIEEISEVFSEVSMNNSTNWSYVLISFAPIVILGALLYIYLRSRGGTSLNRVDSMSKARYTEHQAPNIITFADVGDLQSAKAAFADAIALLRKPEDRIRVGARLPSGVLITGGPGTGKTLLAQAVAGEAGVRLLKTDSSSFLEIFIGVGTNRMKNLFEKARLASPCVLFIDNLDALAARRGDSVNSGQGQDERLQTLNQLKVELETIRTDKSVLVITATNRPDLIDPDLIQARKFERIVHLDPPDSAGRREILTLLARNIVLEPGISLESIAEATVGFVGADLEQVLNEAALAGIREQRTTISTQDLEEGIKIVKQNKKASSAIPSAQSVA